MSIGKPYDPIIIKFLIWIYTDGQKIAANSGYVELRTCQVKELIDLFNELEQNNE